MSFSNIRQRLHRRKYRNKDDTNSLVHDDQFYDIDDVDTQNDGNSFTEGDNVSVTSTGSCGRFSSDVEKQAYEDQLMMLQEQLVSAMIENQNLTQELKQCRENDENERLKRDLEKEKNRSTFLQGQINNSTVRPRNRGTTPTRTTDVQPTRIPQTPPIPHNEMLQPEISQEVKVRSGLDKIWERTVELLYDVIENFNDITQPETAISLPEENLSVKTLKENIRRFKVAVKPVRDTLKGIHNLFAWKSRSYTFIVFIIYMYSVWKGWFVQLVFLLLAVRLVVNYLHFKGFSFHFSYLDPGEPEKESDETLGLSDKFNLVLMVATKVQNYLGTAADTLEKIKNLLTWKHEGTRRILSLSCIGFVAFTFLPQSFMWKFIGLGIGVKIFIVNCVYNKYPKIKKRYDSNYKMWQTLPTDAQYDQQCAKSEMNRYIVISSEQSSLQRSVERHISISSGDSDSDNDNSEFRQAFSLPVTECPQTGWLRGKRTVLLGKDRNLFTLLSKKRGKLYLTKSFLCFERESFPSPKNIVIPLQDIVSIDKVKINQRMPGKGMTIQIFIRSDEGKENVLLFSGVIGRDDIIRDVLQSIDALKRTSPARGTTEAVSRRYSSESTSSRTSNNFTFGAYYVDSDSD